MSISQLTNLIQRAIPMVWDESMSYVEFLAAIQAKVNELVTATNIFLSTDLEAFVVSQLEEWLADGTLASIINEAMPVSDAGSHYTGTTLIAQLQEIGANFDDVDTRVETLETDTAAALAVKTNNVTDKMRIAFHFNYENNQTKLNDVKALGFNTLWIYKQAAFTKDSSRMLAFLDRLTSNGLQAIVQVDHAKVEVLNVDEVDFIDSIKTHAAVVGFTGYDEPIGHGVSKASQETFYTNMKVISKKPVFQVDNDSFYQSRTNYYTPNSYDVFCIDVYTNLATLATEQARKTELFGRITSFLSHAESMPPKSFIPVLPMFEGEGFTLPTAAMIKEYADVLAMFNIQSYGMFAFDVSHDPETLTKTIDTNSSLKDLVILFKNLIHSSMQKPRMILPVGFNHAAEYVADSGFVYANGGGVSLIGTEDGATAVNTITFKMPVNGAENLLVINAGIRQSQDAEQRDVRFYISYDNTNWTTIYEGTFTAAPSGVNHKASTVLDRCCSVFIKLEIDCVGAGVSQMEDYIGFTNLVFGII